MTFSVHAALWNRTWQDDVTPFVREAAAIGFGGVEVSLLGDDASFARVAREARELGVTLTCTTGLGPATDVGSADRQVREAGLGALRKAVVSAEMLGSRTLSGVVYGAWGVTDPARLEERRELAAEALAAVAPMAADAGVTIGIEAINRYETDLVNTADQALDLVARIGAPNVGVLLDAYHMNVEEKDPAAAIRACGSRLVHMHVAGRDRGVPDVRDLQRHRIREALEEVGFDGTITCEMFVVANVPVSSDLTVWRDIEPHPTGAARRALDALRRWWA